MPNLRGRTTRRQPTGHYYRGVSSSVASKKREPKPMREGEQECPECHAGVRVRQDGSLWGHAIGGGTVRAASGGIPCIGSTPTAGTYKEKKDRERQLQQLGKRAAAVGAATVVLSTVLVAPAQAGTRDLTVITSSRGSGKTLKVCRNWPDIPHSTMPTPCGGGTGYLKKGQNSRDKLGWIDADGIRVNKGYALRKAVAGPDVTVAACYPNTYWKKVSPMLGDPGENEDYYYLWDCPAYAN